MSIGDEPEVEHSVIKVFETSLGMRMEYIGFNMKRYTRPECCQKCQRNYYFIISTLPGTPPVLFLKTQMWLEGLETPRSMVVSKKGGIIVEE